tara:strand:- start:5276 stop:5839 length:564 start_codon:yes stop_codon:yes gene_type:complete
MTKNFVSFLVLLAFIGLGSCKQKSNSENALLTSYKLMYAMERVDSYYVVKNPTLKSFIAKAKSKNAKPETLEIRDIIGQSNKLISKIKESENEINGIDHLKGTDVKIRAIEFLEHMKKFELQTQKILTQLTDNDSLNDKNNTQAYSETIQEYSNKHSNYQNALSSFFQKNGIDQKQVDSIVQRIKNK